MTRELLNFSTQLVGKKELAQSTTAFSSQDLNAQHFLSLLVRAEAPTSASLRLAGLAGLVGLAVNMKPVHIVYIGSNRALASKRSTY